MNKFKKYYKFVESCKYRKSDKSCQCDICLQKKRKKKRKQKKCKCRKCQRSHKQKYRNKCPINKCNKCGNQFCKKIVITSVTSTLDTLTAINLTINGNGFSEAKTVIINNTNIPNFKIISDNKIEINMFPITTQNTLTITIASRCTSSSILYNLDQNPIITMISPSSGAGAGAPFISITLFGSNFTTLQSISYDNIILLTSNSPITVVSDNLVSFIAPPINVVGNVAVYVNTLFGKSNTVFYSILPPPII